MPRQLPPGADAIAAMLSSVWYKVVDPGIVKVGKIAFSPTKPRSVPHIIVAFVLAPSGGGRREVLQAGGQEGRYLGAKGANSLDQRGQKD